MNDKHHNKLAVYSFLAKSSKLIIAPLSLTFIAQYLNEIELGFYYTFLSFASMQMLLEAGMAHSLRQYISHAYKLESGEWSKESKIKISKYYSFSIIWFLIISILLAALMYFVSLKYYGGSEQNVEWKYPFYLLILSVFLSTILMPLMILLEGIQRQVVLYKCQAVGSFFSGLILCILLLYDFKLYSLGGSMLGGTIITIFLIIITGNSDTNKLIEILSFHEYKSIFLELFELLSKVSVVWVVGYFFWNSVTLISFKLLDSEMAGRIGFTFAISKAIMNICYSLLQGQYTNFSNNISNNLDVDNKFRRYQLIVSIFVFLSFLLLVIATMFFERFVIINRLVDALTMTQIGIYFFVLTMLTGLNDFVRCYKVEPFMFASILRAILIVSVFYIGCKYNYEYTFFIMSLVLASFYLWSEKVLKKIKKQFNCNVRVNND